MQNTTRLLSFAATLLLSSGLAAAQPAPGGAKAFYTEAAQGNLAEIRMSELARERSAQQGVKDFAAQMIVDHTRALEQLRRVAERSGIPLPSSPSDTQQATVQQLRALQGEAFDRAFLDHQVAEHGRMVRLLEAQAGEPADASAGSFASAVLPQVKQHEGMARSLSHAGGRNLRSPDAPRPEVNESTGTGTGVEGGTPGVTGGRATTGEGSRDREASPGPR